MQPFHILSTSSHCKYTKILDKAGGGKWRNYHQNYAYFDDFEALKMDFHKN